MNRQKAGKRMDEQAGGREDAMEDSAECMQGVVVWYKGDQHGRNRSNRVDLRCGGGPA